MSVRLCSLSVAAGCSSMGMKEREETKGEDSEKGARTSEEKEEEGIYDE